MTQDIQNTLFQLFESVRHDPDAPPAVPVDGWQAGSAELRLLDSFRSMLEQVQQRMQLLRWAEEQLREREEQDRSIFEATTDGLAIVDLEDGRIVEVNPAQCRMHGYSYEEMIGMLPSVTVHPDYHYLVEEALQGFQAGGQFHAQGVALRKDGTTFHFEAHLTPFLYKGKPHILSATRDITEQVQAEQQLREREALYCSIFETTYDGLFIQDLDGCFVEVNPAFCQMYGYTQDELIGMHASVLTAPETLPILADALKSLETGRGFQTVGQTLRKDGTTFYVEAHGSSLTYQGKPHVRGVSRDIPSKCRRTNCWNRAWRSARANWPRCWRSPTWWHPPSISSRCWD